MRLNISFQMLYWDLAAVFDLEIFFQGSSDSVNEY